jgi:hypothetical protein
MGVMQRARSWVASASWSAGLVGIVVAVIVAACKGGGSSGY